ncbi:MAG: hypothetical protein HY820_45560 [Acidobacteria bacterium]|nr:hypothetical protein [Acidobacteriota bacterium]
MDTKPMNTLITALKLLPLVLAAVKAVEDAIPLPGQGKQKLDLVLDVIKSAYEASTSLSKEFSLEKLITLVVPMINQIVALHNALGLFQKSAQPNNA